MRCTGYTVVQGTDDLGVRRRDRRRDRRRRQRRGAADPDPRVRRRRSTRTGVGPGFSGSPDLLRRRATRRDLGVDRRVRRRRRARDADRGDPRRPRPTRRPTARRATPGATARILARAKPLATPLTVSGRRAARWAARSSAPAGASGRPVLADARRPARHLPAADDAARASAVGVSYSSGDIQVGAIGTVAYTDDDRVWAFGHPFEGAGRRAPAVPAGRLRLPRDRQPASSSATSRSTYKLASLGHTLGDDLQRRRRRRRRAHRRAAAGDPRARLRQRPRHGPQARVRRSAPPTRAGSGCPRAPRPPRSSPRSPSPRPPPRCCAARPGG